MIEQCIEVAKNYPTSLVVGNVEFDKVDFNGIRLDSYLGGMSFPDTFPIARLKRNGSTWMSITPMELESHITHILEATGDVLVGGLGMGYYITQIVSKPDVKSVIIIEKDPEVIEAYEALIKTNPKYFSNNKVAFIQGDLFEVLKTMAKSKKVFNYAYLDIWLGMCFDTISNDFEKINDLGGINATKVGFWGMEKFVHEIMMDNYGLDADDMIENIQMELCNEFGEVMEWCYKPSVELMIQLGVGE